MAALTDVICEEFQQASDNLGRFIEQQAQATAAEVGFGYVLTTDAPNNYRALREAFELSATTCIPLPYFVREQRRGDLYDAICERCAALLARRQPCPPRVELRTRGRTRTVLVAPRPT